MIILILSVFYSLNVSASNSDKAALIINKVLSKSDKTYIVEIEDADEWPMSRLNASLGAGEETEKKYDICYQGNPNKVMKILEEIIKEENKAAKKDRKTKVIFNLELAAVRYKGFPSDYIVMESGWLGDKRPYFLDTFKPCR